MKCLLSLAYPVAVLLVLGWGGSSSVAAGVEAARTSHQVFDAMDVDGDGRVSRKEFLDLWMQIMRTRDSNQDGLLSREEYGSAAFSSADTNRDGFVTYAEDQVLREGHFVATDLNGDGFVSLEEYIEVSQGRAVRKPANVNRGEATTSAGYRDELAELERLAELTDAPSLWAADGYAANARLAAVYYDALDWRGESTKVFAWLGLPEDCSTPVPGIVLVHGGGGSAFKDWVLEWTKRGYAAISIAVEGQTDVRDAAGSPHSPWVSHEWAGPQRSGIYHDSSEPFTDQWMYHAVANSILANSLLRSLPEVDADRVGIMGISWGGVITSTVIGIDARFAFAIPVYGCGGLASAPNQYGASLGKNQLYQSVWDPNLRLGRAQMPTLWYSWPGDTHFPLDAQASSYQRQAGPTMVSLVPGFGHGHGNVWQRPESYAFADSIVNMGEAWCQQLGQVMNAGVAEVRFASTRRLDSASLIWTDGTGATGERNWNEIPVAVSLSTDGWLVRARVPDGATAWFVNVRAGELIVSSRLMESR